MYAQFYERLKPAVVEHQHNKMLVSKIFALILQTAEENRTVKVLYLTDEEIRNLNEEMNKIKELLKAYKPGNEVQAISDFFGMPLEVLNELGVKKTA